MKGPGAKEHRKEEGKRKRIGTRNMLGWTGVKGDRKEGSRGKE